MLSGISIGSNHNGTAQSKSPKMNQVGINRTVITSDGGKQSFQASNLMTGGRSGKNAKAQIKGVVHNNYIQIEQLQQQVQMQQQAQKDNQQLYKIIKQNRSNQQKNLASTYLRGIDNQLHGNESAQLNGAKMQIDKSMVGGQGMPSGSSRNKGQNALVPTVTKQRTLALSKGGPKLVQGSFELRKSQN